MERRLVARNAKVSKGIHSLTTEIKPRPKQRVNHLFKELAHEPSRYIQILNCECSCWDGTDLCQGLSSDSFLNPKVSTPLLHFTTDVSCSLLHHSKECQGFPRKE